MTSPGELVVDAFFPHLKAYLIESTGLAYYDRRDADLAQRVQQRLQALDLPDCASYLQRLKDPDRGHAELDTLIVQLTIGETHFFRYAEQFDALRDRVLPEIIERNRGTRRLRIWSAGCASGPEPYSISILLRRELGPRVSGWDVTILGTDINRDLLAQAQAGEFPEWALRGVSDELRQACFTLHGQRWRIAPEFRDNLHFQYHNLVKHPFPSLVDGLCGFDLILCRNVLIYFDVETIRRMLVHFEQCLVDGGWLLVGHAEPNVELFRAFRAVSVPGATLYQKDGEARGSCEPVAPPPAVVTPWPSFDPAPAETAWSLPAPPPPPDVEWSLPAPPPPPDLAAVRALIDRASWEEAERGCRELLRRDPLDAMAQFYLALAQEQRGHPEEAETTLGRALYVDRGFVLAHYHLGLLLQHRGDRIRAARSFANALGLLDKMDPAHPLEDADGLTAANLQELARMHLELLQGAQAQP